MRGAASEARRAARLAAASASLQAGERGGDRRARRRRRGSRPRGRARSRPAARRRRRASAARLTVREVWRATSAALAAVGATSASSRRSSPSRNGLPPVTRAQAATNSGSAPSPIMRPTAAALRSRGSSTSKRRVGGEHVEHRLARAGGDDQAGRRGRRGAARGRRASAATAGRPSAASSTSSSSGCSAARFAVSQYRPCSAAASPSLCAAAQDGLGERGGAGEVARP